MSKPHYLIFIKHKSRYNANTTASVAINFSSLDVLEIKDIFLSKNTRIQVSNKDMKNFAVIQNISNKEQPKCVSTALIGMGSHIDI